MCSSRSGVVMFDCSVLICVVCPQCSWTGAGGQAEPSAAGAQRAHGRGRLVHTEDINTSSVVFSHKGSSLNNNLIAVTQHLLLSLRPSEGRGRAGGGEAYFERDAGCGGAERCAGGLAGGAASEGERGGWWPGVRHAV